MKFTIFSLMIFSGVINVIGGDVVRPATEESLIPRLKIVSPYVSKSNVYKGQIHSHSATSDGGSGGTQSAVDVVTAYKNSGYDFMSLTDHNRIKPDPNVSGILFIHGMEVGTPFVQGSTTNNAGYTAGSYHIGVIDAHDMNPINNPQDVLNISRSLGSFTTIHHPNDSGWSLSLVMSMTNYYAVEVYNGTRDVRYDTTVAGSSKIIDPLLAAGKRFFLIANPDSHDVNTFIATNTSIRVYANNLTESEILENLKTGNFYSSSGAEFSDISVSNNTITVKTPYPCEIQWINNGGIIAREDNSSTNSSYTITDSDGLYIRARAYRTIGSVTTRAWTNPFYIERLGYVPVSRKLIVGLSTNDFFNDITLPDNRMVSWLNNSNGVTTQTISIVNGVYITNSYNGISISDPGQLVYQNDITNVVRFISTMSDSEGNTTQTISIVNGSYITNSYFSVTNSGQLVWRSELSNYVTEDRLIYESKVIQSVTNYVADTTNTVIYLCEVPVYRIYCLTNTTISFDLSNLIVNSNQWATWETAITIATPGINVIVPTLCVTYLNGSNTLTTAINETIYTAWRAITPSNIVANQWWKK